MTQSATRERFETGAARGGGGPICPSCDGSGRMDHGTAGHARSIPCSLCSGSGKVTRTVLVRIQRGRALSRMRENAGLSLRELARMVRVNPTVLSDVEHGRAEASLELEEFYESLGGLRRPPAR